MAIRGTKITGLNNLPNSALSGNIIIPVVDPTVTLATPDGQTLQSTFQQLGNYVLEEAGNLFPEANVANTVSNPAQPNITSVGTLTSLTVSGNANFSNNISVSNNASINTLTVTGISNFGPVANVKIDGGSNGQVLHTYGNGTLYWGLDDATYPGGTNTNVQFNDNGSFGGVSAFTFDKNTSTLDVTNIEVDDITIGYLHIPSVGNGTQQQVLGIVNQNTQQLGWKTVPVYYITVELRDGNTYLSSPNALLRVYPLQKRDGSFLDLNTTQI
jgi:hypothetical protein